MLDVGWAMIIQGTRCLGVYGTDRRGFSLVELLLIIGIISILIALIIPAVQRIRAASDRLSCQNNLRQIGLALHSYHNAQRQFPPGIASLQRQPTMAFVSWNARILPFLEQEHLWREIELAYAANSDFRQIPPHIHRQAVVSVFSCRSDPRSMQASTKLSGISVAFTSYLGVEGLDQFTRNGMLFLDSSIRIADVTDGLSNTLLVGERPPSDDERFGWWYAGWGQNKEGSCEMLIGVCEVNTSQARCIRGPYQFGEGRLTNPCDMFHFWSPHTGGGNFLMSDGSVHFLSYSATSILPALASRAGGEAATP